MPTSAANVERVVDLELQDLGRLRGAHGITADTIEAHLVRPPRPTQCDYADGGSAMHWGVLDEVPHDAADGYLVVYDPAEQTFGHAVKGGAGRPPTCVGYYGSLIDTLNGM